LEPRLNRTAITVGKNVTKVVGATSSEGFLVSIVISYDNLTQLVSFSRLYRTCNHVCDYGV